MKKHCILIALFSALGLIASSQATGTPTTASKKAKKEESRLEEIEVTALPLPATMAEAIAPIDVVEGEKLDDAKATSLGQTLTKQVGVQTSHFGEAVGRPIIRGMDGPRVEVLSNGLSSSDVSTVSQDHAVNIEPFLADRIEIIKGPATLLYGPGAIGGAVHVMDGRIPEATRDRIEARAEYGYGTASGANTVMARFDGGNGEFAWHGDGFKRDAGDYSTPQGTQRNSFVESDSGAAGASWISDSGFIGVAVSRFASTYGNPAEPGDVETAEPPVTLDMDQTRYEIKAKRTDPWWRFDQIEFNAMHADYAHAELEGDAVGTRFAKHNDEARLEMTQSWFGQWLGAFGLQYADRDLTAIGEEAFLPAVNTRARGLFWVQQRQWDRLRLELGARADGQRSQTATTSRKFSASAFSLGAGYALSDRWSLKANVDHAERAPIEEELFSNGPHLATNAFEIGEPSLRTEAANQAELGLQYRHGPLQAKASAYRNRFDRYIYLDDVGRFEGELPIRQWTQRDAKFTGYEAEAICGLGEHASGAYELRTWIDKVKARLDDGTALPRMAPARVGVELNWRRAAWRASMSYVRYHEQDDIAPLETPTAGFDLVNAHLSYRFDASAGGSWEWFVDAQNLTDRIARLHTSFIKDRVLLPGRQIQFGVRAAF